jgi:hypothetical protein
VGSSALARAAGFFCWVTGSLSRATGNFFGLSEVLLEPIGNLVNRRFFSGRRSGAFAVVGAGGKFRKRILGRHIPLSSRFTYKLFSPNLLLCEDLRVRENAKERKE